MERTVIMLTWEYPPHLVGGLARHVFALSRELARQGTTVHVLTRSAPGLPAQSAEEGVTVHRVAPIFQEPPDFKLWACHLNFALLEAGVNLLRRLEEPVLLHAHDWLVAHAARSLKHLFRAPLVATIHATEHGRNRGIHDPGQQYINDVEWWLTYEAWRVIVCSESMRHEVKHLFGLADDKVAVIPNGIELPAAGAGVPVPPRTHFAQPGERLLFHLGRLVPEKGAGVLLEAVPHLVRRHNLRVVIAGSGPYRHELERRAAELGIAGRVYFAGYVPDHVARALYSYADVAVVPSLYEPFGIVALEAMAAGAPLVASDVGGLADIVQHGVNGLKALPGHVASLAEQVDRLLSDRPLADRLAKEALRQVRERYSWEGVARSTLDFYRGVHESCAQSDWCAPHPAIAALPQPGELPGRYTM
ncbi:MAG: glycosyltransferase family 4 protein [Bacillota bacterium]